MAWGWRLTAAMVLLVPAASRAQPFEWRPVNYQIAQMIEQGHDDEALPLIEQTARRCPEAATPVEAGLCSAILSENRASVLERRSDLVGAEAGFRTMVAERSRVIPAR